MSTWNDQFTLAFCNHARLPSVALPLPLQSDIGAVEARLSFRLSLSCLLRSKTCERRGIGRGGRERQGGCATCAETLQPTSYIPPVTEHPLHRPPRARGYKLGRSQNSNGRCSLRKPFRLAVGKPWPVDAWRTCWISVCGAQSTSSPLLFSGNRQRGRRRRRRMGAYGRK